MRKWAVILAAAILAVSLAPAAHAQKPEASRLILKDGSYQPILKYEVKGDRVRYLSAERFEWEEVPYSMVDWAATKKWEEDRLKAANPDVKAADAEEEAARKAEAAMSPEVSPGLHLPRQGGVFVMDVYAGRPELIELEQNGSEINKNTKSNILRAAINPIASAKQTIELKGAHAKVQAHLGQPVIYANLADEQPEQPEQAGGPPARDIPVSDRYRILRMQEKKDSRVVGNIKIALTGHVSQQTAFVPTLVEQVADGPWYKITPAAPLEPGEYALVEMLPENQINLYVWDFGVNPSAPENPSAWKPVPVAPGEATKTPPKLDDRPPM
jgi:hypothetical protein